MVHEPVLKRDPSNPVLTRKDIPPFPPDLVDVTSVFNPGAVQIGDRTLLMLRVQNRARETFFCMAESRDGFHFQVNPEPVRLNGIEKVEETIYHYYDARITPLEGRYYIQFAMDMDSGCMLGMAQTGDFRNFEFMGIASEEDCRNGVLFPEKIGGYYLRLDRPNRTALDQGPLSGDTIRLSRSRDLVHWSPGGDVISGRFHYWDELIGPGTPPVKTREGWLLLYHGVAMHLSSAYIYQAGVLLLDLEDPCRVKGRSRQNILEPREPYEMTGQVPNVVFPGGWIVEGVDEEGFARPDSRVRVYYGAADTVVCLARSTIGSLVTAAMNR
jgi:beta-1,4-mannooligosaccharide/beta-1,4-mannosyl-N-acetylglucosamine phosphorylase